MARDSRVEYPFGLADVASKLGVSLGEGVQFDAADAVRDLAAQFHGESVYDCPSEGVFAIHGFTCGSMHGEELANPFGAEGAFQDPMEPGAEFGGLFGKIFKASGLKKMSEKTLSKAAGKPVHITNVKVDVKGSVKGLAKGIGTAAAIASFAVPGAGPLIGGGALAALASADKLIGQAKGAVGAAKGISTSAKGVLNTAKDAQKIINNTKAMAALGDPNAKRGVAVLAAAQKIRDVRQVPPHQAAVPPPPKAPTHDYIQMHTQPQVHALAQKTVATKTAQVKPHWWSKVLGWFHLEVKAKAA